MAHWIQARVRVWHVRRLFCVCPLRLLLLLGQVGPPEFAQPSTPATTVTDSVSHARRARQGLGFRVWAGLRTHHRPPPTDAGHRQPPPLTAAGRSPSRSLRWVRVLGFRGFRVCWSRVTGLRRRRRRCGLPSPAPALPRSLARVSRQEELGFRVGG